MLNETINLYLLDISSLHDENIFKRELSNVKEYRKKKVSKYKNDNDKYLSLGAEILIKKVCKDFNINYDDLEIDFGKNNKPYFKNQNLFFNISHSGKKVLCAVSTFEIGCDIQIIDEINLKFAERYFTKKENSYILKCADKQNAFYKIWTLKESYLKCLGSGLNLPLNSFEIVINNNKILLNNNDEYVFYSKSLNDYRYSYCVNKGKNKIVKFETKLENISINEI